MSLSDCQSVFCVTVCPTLSLSLCLSRSLRSTSQGQFWMAQRSRDGDTLEERKQTWDLAYIIVLSSNKLTTLIIDNGRTRGTRLPIGIWTILLYMNTVQCTVLYTSIDRCDCCCVCSSSVFMNNVTCDQPTNQRSRCLVWQTDPRQFHDGIVGCQAGWLALELCFDTDVKPRDVYLCRGVWGEDI